jgi:hypothetical protein
MPDVYNLDDPRGISLPADIYARVQSRWESEHKTGGAPVEFAFSTTRSLNSVVRELSPRHSTAVSVVNQPA